MLSFSKDALLWLTLEGLIPLFGAGLLYVAFGYCKRIASPKPVPFAWREAVDSMGWLYGALIIAVQSAFRCFYAQVPATILGSALITTAILCGLLLLAAMGERGQDPTWQAPTALKRNSFILVIIILGCGYWAHSLPVGA